MIKHLEGSSTHNVAAEYGLSQPTIYRTILRQLKKIPNSNHLTEIACDKFSGYLLIDGKYLSVEGREMVLIWAIDYFTHDIVWYELVARETSAIYYQIFHKIKHSGYQLKFLICDDLSAIRTACLIVFKDVKIQICTVHILRNIKKFLDTKNNNRDREFYYEMVNLFKTKNLKHFAYTVKRIVNTFSEVKYLTVIKDLNDKSEYVVTYLKYTRCPSTSNLIECYNKHLETRLRKIDGFKKEKNALLWLNAYIYYKRTTKLKHCKNKFKYLNGTAPITLTIKNNFEKIYLLKSLIN